MQAGRYHLAWSWGGQQAGVSRAGLGGLLEAAPVCLDTPVGCCSVSQCPALPAEGTASGCGLQGSWDVLPLPWPLPCPCRLSAPGEWGAARRRASRAPSGLRLSLRRVMGAVLTRVHTLTRLTHRATQAAPDRAFPSAPGLQVAASWGSCSKQTPSGAGTERLCSRTRVGSWNQEPSRPRVTRAFLQWGRGGASGGPAAPAQLRPQHRPGLWDKDELT